MATSKGQRIGIWVIAAVLTIGTIGGFIAMTLAPKNQAKDTAVQQKEQEKMIAEYRKQQEEAQKANRPLEGYEATAFDSSTITDLKVETLREGDGKMAEANSSVTANYFGWTSDGKIFDSTNKDGKVTPIDFSLNQVIEGWSEGLTGVKEGSVVKLEIPADKAYGSEDTGTGQPVGPLMFIVELKAVK